MGYKDIYERKRLVQIGDRKIGMVYGHYKTNFQQGKNVSHVYQEWK